MAQEINANSLCFILTPDSYKEITYSELCQRQDNDITYQDKKFLLLHGMLLEVTEADYIDFHKKKRREKYLKEQSGKRGDTFVVIQNDIENKHTPTTTAAMVTGSQIKKLPTHVQVIDSASGLTKDSVVMLEQIRTIDKRRLGAMIGHVNEKTMAQIEDAVLCSLGIER